MRTSAGIRVLRPTIGAMMHKFLFLLLPFVITTSFAANVTIDVYAALAPNALGSPSFAAWQANAMDALEAGQTSAGDPNTPAYFQRTNSVTGNQILVTSFPSWMGAVDPGTVFGGAFANEYGNRLTFPLHIISPDAASQFSISDLSLDVHSTDGQDAFGFSFSGYSYNTGYVGLDWGVDGMKGTADDQWITGGPNTQLVNELFGRGSGNGYWPCEASPGNPNPCPTNVDKQAGMNAAAAYPAYGSPYQITATWTLAGANPGTGSISVDVQPAPEPASFALAGVVVLALGLVRRHRSR